MRFLDVFCFHADADDIDKVRVQDCIFAGKIKSCSTNRYDAGALGIDVWIEP